MASIGPGFRNALLGVRVIGALLVNWLGFATTPVFTAVTFGAFVGVIPVG